MKLHLERKHQDDSTGRINGVVMMTPEIGPEYWEYRVMLTETQAVVGFPKFSTIGIGFAVETDWNTNLPYGVSTEEIFDHIAHNKGDDSIPDERVLEAIKLIQAAATEDHGDVSHLFADRAERMAALDKEV